MQQRPTSLVGLLRHAIALRWRALSPMGRKATLAVGAIALVGAVSAWRASSCSCSSGCPYQRAAITGEALPEAPAHSETAAHEDGQTGCRYSR